MNGYPGIVSQARMAETSFMSRGACVNEDPQYFDTSTRDGKTTMTGYVTVSGTRIPREIAYYHARKVCGRCLVLRDCRNYITRFPSEDSIWAGMLPEERNHHAAS